MSAVTATMAAPPSMLPDTKAALEAASACGPPNASKHRPAPFKDLRTPLSAHPGIQSPLSTSTPTWMKREPSTSGSMKTPVTPPSAYLDFLRAISPSMASPMSTGASTHFSFTAGARSPAFPAPPRSANFLAPSAPLSARPRLPSNPSNNSNVSSATSDASSESKSSTKSAPTTTANAANMSSRRAELAAPVPPSPGVPPRPASAATASGRFPASTRPGLPRRPSVIIPESPSSSTFSPSTLSGSYTPITATVRSPGSKEKTSPVVIRHVVTRTITYTRRTQSGSAHPSTSPSSQSPALKVESPKAKGRARAISQPLVSEAPKGKKRRTD